MAPTSPGFTRTNLTRVRHHLAALRARLANSTASRLMLLAFVAHAEAEERRLQALLALDPADYLAVIGAMQHPY